MHLWEVGVWPLSCRERGGRLSCWNLMVCMLQGPNGWQHLLLGNVRQTPQSPPLKVCPCSLQSQGLHVLEYLLVIIIVLLWGESQACHFWCHHDPVKCPDVFLTHVKTYPHTTQTTTTHLDVMWLCAKHRGTEMIRSNPNTHTPCNDVHNCTHVECVQHISMPCGWQFLMFVMSRWISAGHPTMCHPLWHRWWRRTARPLHQTWTGGRWSCVA